ncbi:MAG: 30S ribosomal protein S16 [Candidatus Nealsonbacteria bacterium]|nr:30S ribosomal protein S16 [Candidatus Nealsonbacteria bacterium]
MITIRFLRIGKKKQPVFKIVVTDKKNPPTAGRFIDEVGFHNPITKENRIDKDKVLHWISKGAKPSDTVRNLLIKGGIIQGQKAPKHKIVEKKEKLVQEKPEIKKEEVVIEEKEAESISS